MKAWFYAVVLTFTIAVISCDSDRKSRIERAEELGRNDAIEFVDRADNKVVNELKLQDYLLMVRTKERDLKDAGYTKEAEKYIESFKHTLQEEDSVLYNLIF